MNAEPKTPAQPSFLLLVPVLYDAAFYHLSYYSVSKLGLLYLVDQLCAMKEDVIYRTPAMLAADTRRYEVNDVGMLNRQWMSFLSVQMDTGCPEEPVIFPSAVQTVHQGYHRTNLLE